MSGVQRKQRLKGKSQTLGSYPSWGCYPIKQAAILWASRCFLRGEKKEEEERLKWIWQLLFEMSSILSQSRLSYVSQVLAQHR